MIYKETLTRDVTKGSVTISEKVNKALYDAYNVTKKPRGSYSYWESGKKITVNK